MIIVGAVIILACIFAILSVLFVSGLTDVATDIVPDATDPRMRIPEAPQPPQSIAPPRLPVNSTSVASTTKEGATVVHTTTDDTAIDYTTTDYTTTDYTTTDYTTTDYTTTDYTTTVYTTTDYTTTDCTTTGYTTADLTTKEDTTVEPTTVKPTTAQPTRVEPTTAEPTTVEPTTVEPTTVKLTTVKPTRVEPTTVTLTTIEPTTVEQSSSTVVYDTTTDAGPSTDSKLYAGLTCVTSERATDDTVDYTLLYQPCDNVVYSVGTRCRLTGNENGLLVVAGLADKGKFLGFNYDGSVDVSCYANLGSVQGWEDNGYAALGVVLANDFSDVAQVATRLKHAFDTIEGTGRPHMPKIAGIKINPTDADITKENAEKLAQLLLVNNVSLVIFESHTGIKGVPCKIAVSNVLINKNNVIKLTEDIDLPVAISSTAGLLLITTDGQRNDRGSNCKGSRVVPRSSQRCGLLGGAAQDGHSVIPGLGVVIEYLVTDSANSMLPDSTVKQRAKYGVAIFDLQHYHLDQYPNCPPLDLSAFKLPRPAPTV
ncbi:uncharacterized protein LOC144107399 [Amblyomma americanum]